MTHDPFCPCAPIDPIRPGAVHTANSASCLCVLIAQVRADELRRPSEDGWMSVRAVLGWEDQVRADEQHQVAIRLTAYHAKGCIGGTSGLGCGCGLWKEVITYSVEQS